jgi:hypothetical protein
VLGLHAEGGMSVEEGGIGDGGGDGGAGDSGVTCLLALMHVISWHDLLDCHRAKLSHHLTYVFSRGHNHRSLFLIMFGCLMICQSLRSLYCLLSNVISKVSPGDLREKCNTDDKNLMRKETRMSLLII